MNRHERRAAAHISKAVSNKAGSNNAGYFLNLGTALEQQGLNEQALNAFENAVTQNPGSAELRTRLGNVLVVLQQPARAISSFEEALKLSPHYWFAANSLARLLVELGRLEEALVNLDLCDKLQPGQALTINARAWTLCNLNRFEESLLEAKRAQALEPANADICFNVGIALHKLLRYELALEQFDWTLDLRPDFVGALHNKAIVLGEIQRFDEALAVYRHIKEIDPDNAQADWNASLLQLLRGDFAGGWQGREARWRVATLPGTAKYPKFSRPMWRGERDVAGKTILICADEGLGDTIQFVRYVPMLAALGARVILLPQESLYSLLSELPGVVQCLLGLKAGLPAFDLHCPAMSLPFAFGTRLDSIPAATSYLPRPAAARMRTWEDRLGPRDQLRIGLVWSGNTGHGNDHNRSIPLRALSRIVVPGATFISLQKDPRPEDRAALRERTDILDLTEHLTDFSETAALIGCLDLVITVDTSVAHLAAALGCPTWILLPSVPDWRWLLDRDDSPWYPTVRLFRQDATRDYLGVVDRVRDELAMEAAAFRARLS
jgi:tetratricopeptide (TPR) repeat protein